MKGDNMDTDTYLHNLWHDHHDEDISDYWVDHDEKHNVYNVYFKTSLVMEGLGTESEANDYIMEAEYEL